MGGYELTKTEDVDPVRDALNSVYNNKTADKFSVISYENTVAEWARVQALINEVYQTLVSTTYSYAVDALTKLFEGGFSNDEAKALATLKLFISYEEDCLGGYEKASYDKVKALMAGVQSLIKSGHNGDLSPARMSTTQTRTKFVRGQGAVKVAAIAEVNFGVACAVGYSLCLFLMCFD